MNIYIYGNKTFVKEIKSLLIKSNIDNIEHIKFLDVLKNTIKEYSDQIFIIDDEKIIKNDFLNQINIFKSKDSISKKFLSTYGIEDICFNSFDGLIKYILLKLNTPSQDDYVDEISNGSLNITEDNEREITCIDDIYDNEMETAMSDLNNQDKKEN